MVQWRYNGEAVMRRLFEICHSEQSLLNNGLLEQTRCILLIKSFIVYIKFDDA